MDKIPTPYDLDASKSDIHKEYMMFEFDPSDPWGSHHHALYGCCQCMVLRGMQVPHEYHFSAGGFSDSTEVKDEWYLYELTTTMTDDDLLVFANDLNAAENKARLDGMSY